MTANGVDRSPGRRRIGLATWRPPRSGEVHLLVELDVASAERWCRERAGVSLVHVVGSGLARGIAAVPETNSFASFGRVRRRGRVDVSYAIDNGRGDDLTAHRVDAADGRSPAEVARELLGAARAIRRGDDAQFGHSIRLAGRVPPFLVRPGIALSGFIAGAIGRPARGLGLDAHPFGSVLLSSVETWDLERVLSPLIPFARLGIVVVLGATRDRPVVRDGTVVPGRTAHLGLTMDHRLMDGAHAGEMIAVMRRAVEDPGAAWPG